MWIVGDGVTVGVADPDQVPFPKLSEKQGTTPHEPQNNLKRTQEETRERQFRERSPLLGWLVILYIQTLVLVYLSALHAWTNLNSEKTNCSSGRTSVSVQSVDLGTRRTSCTISSCCCSSCSWALSAGTLKTQVCCCHLSLITTISLTLGLRPKVTNRAETSQSRPYVLKMIVLFDFVSQSCMYGLLLRRFQNRDAYIVHRDMALINDLLNYD